MPELSIILSQEGETAVNGELGNHSITIDRPIEKGGNDLGAMGGQYLVASIGGCFSSTFFAAAISRDIKVTGFKVKVSANLSEELPKRFDKISIKASYDTCSAPEQFTKLLEIAEQGCIALNTIKSGLPVSVQKD